MTHSTFDGVGRYPAPFPELPKHALFGQYVSLQRQACPATEALQGHIHLHQLTIERML